MEIISTLLSPDIYIEPFRSVLAWVVWIGVLLVNVILLRRWRAYNKPMNDQLWGILVVLSLSVPLTSLFIGIRLPPGVISPPPGVALDPTGPAIMLFSTIPWMLAAGIFGPTAAAGIGLLSGLLLAMWDTHNPFTPLEIALFATLFAAAINQRYRTNIFRFLRHPLAAALSLALIYPILYLITTPFAVVTPPEVRLEYTISSLGIAALVFGIELFVGGLFTEIIASAIPYYWGGVGELLPSPSEKSLQTRLLFILAPLALIVVTSLLAGVWYYAGKTAREMMNNSMENAAQVAAQNIPYFLEVGYIETSDLTINPDLRNTDILTETLALSINEKPYFDQLLVFDQQAELAAAYPNDDFSGTRMPIEEKFGVYSALDNFPIQTFSLPPDRGKTTAQISFVAPIHDAQDNVLGVLVARTDLGNNLLSQPVISSLSSLSEFDGHGYLLDHNQKILYHPDPTLVMKEFTGTIPEQAGEDVGLDPDARPSLLYFEPGDGNPWSIVMMVPKAQVDRLSLSIAVPLIIIVIVLSIIGIFVMRWGLRSVTHSLTNLATGAGHISVGDLEKSMPVESDDELGQLAQSFEQMRLNLKSQLDDLNRMVAVSQGVASSLQIQDAIQPVLEAALETGAGSARVVFPRDVVPELNGSSNAPVSLGLGPSTHSYSYLDEQLLAYARRHKRLVLSSMTRPRLFNLPESVLHPASLAAFALSHDKIFLGVLWVAFDVPHTFPNEEVNYLSEIADQASRAASNSRLYMNAEVERQQLSAILTSSPDPILVTNRNNHLVMANPAAWNVLDMRIDYADDDPIEKIIAHKELLNLMRSPSEEAQTIEVTLPNRQVYLATANPVVADGRRVGRICVLTNVTRLKELNALKSEFVSTVSHDMRYPLTLIHGYASMVEMVGQLNDQQTGYLKKIIENVDSMSHLVNNLLDLRRIEAGIGLHIEMVQVREVVDKVINSLEPQVKQKRIQMTSEIPVEMVPLIEADQALLQKAIYNLVENAVKYTPSEGKVNVHVYDKEDRIYFEVSDTGVGISPVDQAQLFETFYHRPKKEGVFEPSGSGLGLAIVKSIADRHKGHVWVESQLGKGSTFYLAVPQQQTDSGIQTLDNS